MADSETKIQIPPDFLLGAASAAHQVEGNNTKNDWWHYEQEGRLPKSGLGADHYHRYGEDFGLAKSIGLNAMRISIEWSRIEPEEGSYDMSEVEHYRSVLRSLKALGMTRMVTLHHYTFPLWLAEQGGFMAKATGQKFAAFSKFIAAQLGDDIDLWVTINEPEVYSMMSYRIGLYPPFVQSTRAMITMIHRLIAAHKLSYNAIKKVLPQAQIGIAKNNVYYDAFRPRSWTDRTAIIISKYITNNYILRRIRNHMDFIGLNYYFYQTLQFHIVHGWQVKNLEGPKSDMGWRTYPKGIYYIVKDLSAYGKPIYITENGIANAHDDMRRRFIKEHLQWLMEAKAEGVDVRGYFYWSLTDTYEWKDGFDPKFGLIEVDFHTLARRVRPSSTIFKELTQ